MDYLIPRLISSFLSGVILSQTGSLIQLGTRNILASPSTLGIDGLAILWLLIFHSIVIFLELDGLHPLVHLLMGIPCFILVGLLYARFIQNKGKSERLVLVGLTFNLLVGAIFSLWQFFFLAFNLPFPAELWFGHFRYANFQTALILMLIEGLLLGGLWLFLDSLRLFSFGTAVAKNWGLNQDRSFRFIFVAIAVGTLVVVNLFGAFSFLGLIFPLVARKIWFAQKDLEGELLHGALTNGLLFMLLDALCYYFPIYGAEIPVGLIVTAVGAVSLIILLWTSYKDAERLANHRQ